MKTLKLTAFFILFIFVNAQPSFAATVVCIKSDGTVITRSRKCKVNETRFSSNSYLSGINANSTSINSNTASIATNTTSIAANTASIAAIPNPASIYVVAKSGTAYTTLQSAIDAAVADGVSGTSPALIKVSPGIFTTTSGIDVLSNIRVQGSGIGTTIIRFSGADGLTLRDSTGLESLTIDSDSTSAFILVQSAGSSRISNVDINYSVAPANTVYGMSISGASGDRIIDNVTINMNNSSASSYIGCFIGQTGQTKINNLKIYVNSQSNFGIQTSGSANISIVNSNISTESVSGSSVGIRHANSGSGTGLLLMDSIVTSRSTTGSPDSVYLSTARNLTIENSRIVSIGATGNGAVVADDNGNIVISNSTVQCDSPKPTLLTADSGSQILIGNSKLSGGAASQGAGTNITCAGVYDENLAFSSNICP